MKANLKVTTALVAVLAMTPLLAHAQKIWGPADISYLANLQEQDKASYNFNVMEASLFSGQGKVFHTITSHNNIFEIDVGTGSVWCLQGFPTDFAGLRRGDKVRVKGVMGGAMTLRAMKKLDELMPSAPGDEELQKDSITLIRGSCHVEKVNKQETTD